jgi:hypothetical protein
VVVVPKIHGSNGYGIFTDVGILSSGGLAAQVARCGCGSSSPVVSHFFSPKTGNVIQQN